MTYQLDLAYSSGSIVVEEGSFDSAIQISNSKNLNTIDTDNYLIAFPSGFSIPMTEFEEMCKEHMRKKYPEEFV